MAEYLELLIHTSDTFYRDPIKKDYNKDYDLSSGVKQGYLQRVKPVGSPWGRCELDPKRFLRIIIPELQFDQDWLSKSDDEILDAKWRFPLDKLLSVGEFEALKNIKYNEDLSKLLTIEKSIERISDIVTLVKYDDQITHIKLHGSAGDFDIEEDGGGDYTSLKTAIETEAADISGGAVDANFFINLAWDNPDTAAWDIDSWTMGSNKMLIQTVGIARTLDGTYNDNGTRYRFETAGETFDIETSNCTVDGIQWKFTGSAVNGGIVVSTAVTGVEIKNGICDGNAQDSIGINVGNAGTLLIENCVLDGNGIGSNSEGVFVQGASSVVTMKNCTIYNWDDGIEQDDGTVDVLNSLVFANNDNFDGSFNSIDYCASEGGEGTNAVTITQIASDYAALVTDAPSGDFSPTNVDSELVDNGTAVGRPATDIIGNSWDTDDIGAFAFQAGAPAGRPLPQRVLSGPFAGPLGGPF